MTPSDVYSAWYAVRVKPRHEKLAAEHLEGRGFNTLLPLARSTRVWRHRASTASVPVFDGYVFCQFDVTRRLPVLTAPGVLYVLGTSEGPVPIKQSELRSLRIIIQSNLPLTPWQTYTPGTDVLIVSGPLLGARGKVLDVANDRKLIVSVSLLQRSLAVQLDRDWIRAVDGNDAEIAHELRSVGSSRGTQGGSILVHEAGLPPGGNGVARSATREGR
jgi:transcription antitermination factor NusG